MTRFLVVGVLFSFAMVLTYGNGCSAFAAGRWDGQFRANNPTSITGTSGADGCAAIPAASYVHLTSQNDAYVGFGALKADAGIGIGTGNKCTDADAGVSCDVVLFSVGVPSFTQTNPGINRVCVRATDGGTVTVTIGVQ